ncbi:hypothetical protein N7478_010311 [Penicillium angulare]|uniref:uncharacterized protein n=1 Tax=Penicillium angulare TaxID=116970 RepID=UPI0025415A0D|nr:uncharacterized protein N7478_010311 [Penicillium angulare]KAJ5267503.1 hypothetical protein N7478_010311 [Penicillium angulare]
MNDGLPGQTIESNEDPMKKDRKIIHGSLKDLGLPQIAGEKKITSGLIVRTESPWETYRELTKNELAGPVIIASRRSSSHKRVAIRQISNNRTNELIFRFRLYQHPNLLSPREIYLAGNLTYGLFEIASVSLEQLVKHPGLFPTEAELASIMSQVPRLKANTDPFKHYS